MSKQPVKTKRLPSDYSDPHAAIAAAHEVFSSKADWREFLTERGITTAQEARDFVLFNMLRSIMENLDPSSERLFLTTIQGSILHSTFKFK